MEENTFDFGLRLKQLRTRAKLTQRKVADRLDVSPTMISEYERNLKAPTYPKLIRLAGLFRVSTDYLLGLQSRRCIFIDGLTEEQENALNVIVDSMRNKK